MALSGILRRLRQHLWAVMSSPATLRHLCACHPVTISENLQPLHQCSVHTAQLHKRHYSEERHTPETDSTSSLNLDGNSKRVEYSNMASDPPSHTGHLEYDLDKLLRNIREAQQSSQLPQESTEARSGRSSAMSIEELVRFLREEKGEGVCVIHVPPEREYVRYFVTCVGVGGRHLQRMAGNLAAEVREKSVLVYTSVRLHSLDSRPIFRT